MKYTIVKYWFKNKVQVRILPGFLVPHNPLLRDYVRWHWPEEVLLHLRSRLMELKFDGSNKFQELYQEYKYCCRCPLGDKVKGRVFFRGSLRAPLMFVGEAPGEEEDRYGVPFVGKAGKILDHILKLCGLTWEDYCIVNPVLCRPLGPKGGNGKPSVHEIAACIHHLAAMFHIVRPGGVILLGSYARDVFLEKKLDWGTKVNFPVDDIKVPLGVTYHPAYYDYQGGIQACSAQIDSAVMMIRQVWKSMERKHPKADWCSVLDWPLLKAIKAAKWEKFCAEKGIKEEEE